MPTNREYDGWVWAPVRFVVWVLAFVYLGRIQYDNSLWDLRRLSAGYVVVHTLSLAITLGFVYWNLFVVPTKLGAIIWTTVATLVSAVFVLQFIVEVGVQYQEDKDPLERRQYEDDAVTNLDIDRRVAGRQLGDVPTRDPRNVGDDA